MSVEHFWSWLQFARPTFAEFCRVTTASIEGESSYNRATQYTLRLKDRFYRARVYSQTDWSLSHYSLDGRSWKPLGWQRKRG